MAQRRALFQGDSEIDQIFKIFQGKGTPDNVHWPGVEEFPEFKQTFPKWNGNPKLYDKIRTQVGDDGVDLIDQMVQFVPEKRISAQQALKHKFFDDLDKELFADALNILANMWVHI